jgi:predicted DNA-binding transcriptional regulator AlpA
MSEDEDYRVIGYNDLEPQFGLKRSRTQIDRDEKDGGFPESFKLGKGRRARRVWFRKDIIKWLEWRAGH